MSPSEPVLAKSDNSDPRQIALVQTIIDKTVAKKLYWNRLPTGFACVISGPNQTMAMKIEFRGLAPDMWQNFLVSSNEGVILRVEFQPMNTVLSRLAGVEFSNTLYGKISELFSIVSHVGEGAIDRAKKILENL
jgi:hypothetical protein